MEYADFAIRLERASEKTFRARVVNSPAGQGGTIFLPPDWDPRTLERWVTYGRDLVRVIHGRSEVKADQIGQDLFRALFTGPIADLYAESLGRISRGPEIGLRVRLCFDPEDPATFCFARLPWELLCIPGKRDFLGCLRGNSVCRYLDVPRPESSLSLNTPIRIGVLASSPVDLPALNLMKEAKQIQTAWERRSGAEVVFLKRATITSLRRQLLDGNFHVLHFMGHGGFNVGTGKGCVILETESRHADCLNGEDLADLLKDIDTLRLVVLNACRTAQNAFEQNFEPFGGVAAALIRAGLPAVIAMQLSISDPAALAFSERFYERLAQGDSLDVAMAEGRIAVKEQDRQSMEWAIPTLFLRSLSGRIFDLAGRIELEGGLAHLENGDLIAAERSFLQALTAHPRSEEARVYLCLCRLSGRPLHSVSLSAADQLDATLCDLANCKKSDVVTLARILLTILRQEVYMPRRLKPPGGPLPQSFQELEPPKPNSREKKLLSRMILTKRAAALLNIGY